MLVFTCNIKLSLLQLIMVQLWLEWVNETVLVAPFKTTLSMWPTGGATLWGCIWTSIAHGHIYLSCEYNNVFSCHTLNVPSAKNDSFQTNNKYIFNILFDMLIKNIIYQIRHCRYPMLTFDKGLTFNTQIFINNLFL